MLFVFSFSIINGILQICIYIWQTWDSSVYRGEIENYCGVFEIVRGGWMIGIWGRWMEGKYIKKKVGKRISIQPDVRSRFWIGIFGALVEK